MPHYCCVPLCRSASNSEEGKKLSFHCFPKDGDLLKKWINSIKREKHFQVNKHTRICSLHFKEYGRVRQRLKADAVPGVFNWCTPKAARRKLFKHAVKTPNVSTNISTKRNVDEHSYACSKLNTAASRNITENEGIHDDQESVDETEETLSNSDDSLINISAEPSPNKVELNNKNLKLLHLRSDEKFTLLRFCNSDDDI